jgi:hypothetical protein
VRMEQKTLNAKQLLTIEECRVVRRHLKADMENWENGTCTMKKRHL